MRVYLASAYQSRELIRKYAAELTAIGFTVTSSWLEEKHEINKGTTGAATELPDSQVAAHAQTDFAEIAKSDMLVLFTQAATGEVGGGGRHVETGYAMALKKPVIVVGIPENVFHRLGRAAVIVEDWHLAVIELSRRLVLDRSGQVADQ